MRNCGKAFKLPFQARRFAVINVISLCLVSSLLHLRTQLKHIIIVRVEGLSGATQDCQERRRRMHGMLSSRWCAPKTSFCACTSLWFSGCASASIIALIKLFEFRLARWHSARKTVPAAASLGLITGQSGRRLWWSYSLAPHCWQPEALPCTKRNAHR